MSYLDRLLSLAATVTTLSSVYMKGAKSFYLGNDDGERLLLSTDDYSHVLLIPDPDEVAPSPGTVSSLKAYSAASDVDIRLVVLLREEPDASDASSASAMSYRVKAASGFLTSPADVGFWYKDLLTRNMPILKGEVVAFAIYTQNPVPYEIKRDCDISGMFLVHRFSDDSVNFGVGDSLTFERNPSSECLVFSYVVEVVETATTTTTMSWAQNDASEGWMNGDHHSGSSASRYQQQQSVHQDPHYQDPCLTSSSDCNHDTGSGNSKDDDLFRYIIFGPLVVLWIIVSILCTLKIKRRCCAKNVPIVRPTQPVVTNPDPYNRSRRPRFARITMSRAPPEVFMMTQQQPKPMAQLTPSAALPPYPGVADDVQNPPMNMAAAPKPSYPPPAYSSLPEAKDEEVVYPDEPSSHSVPFGAASAPFYSSVQYSDVEVHSPGTTETTERPQGVDQRRDHADDQSRTGSERPAPDSHQAPWTRSYHGQSNVSPYTEPPPPYRQEPDSGHM